MIPDDQILLTFQPADNLVYRISFHVMTDVPQDINDIVLINDGVIVLNQFSVHLIHIIIRGAGY